MRTNELANHLMQAFIQLHRQRMRAGPVGGLRPAELVVLHHIQQAEVAGGFGLMVSELSAVLKVSPTSITQHVNRLVKKGFVDRAEDPDDRRAVRIRVAGAGKTALAEVFDEMLSRYSGLVQFLGEEQSIELIKLLHQVHKYFETATC